MFRWRDRTDAQPRSKNGQPPHPTTGVATASCAHGSHGAVIQCRTASPPTASPAIGTRSGKVSSADHLKRRSMSSSSGLASSSRDATSGSSAMPQIGHAPGVSRTTSGCIGQVYRRAARRDRRGPATRGRGRCCRRVMVMRRRCEVLQRIGLELRQTRPAAEVIGRALVLMAAGGPSRIDLHATDGVGHRAPPATGTPPRAEYYRS